MRGGEGGDSFTRFCINGQKHKDSELQLNFAFFFNQGKEVQRGVGGLLFCVPGRLKKARVHRFC